MAPNSRTPVHVMHLSPSIKNIIQTVEDLSGRPVVVQEDASLSVISTVTTARGSAPFHLVRHKPVGELLNYTLAYQLGFLVRLFSLPKDDRWETSASDEERALAIKESGLSELDPQLASSLLDSIIIQLRSCVVGFKVDEWIAESYPELKPEQEASAHEQLKQNAMSLSPEIRSQYPRKLIDTNSTMNAAYAKYWSGRLDDPQILLPYESLGYTKDANALYDVFLDTGDDPSFDRTLDDQTCRRSILPFAALFQDSGARRLSTALVSGSTTR